MPAPAAPPPLDEAGAITIPRTLNRWLDVNPVHRLTRTHTYFVIPEFSLVVQEFDYSNLVGAYNYESTRNFTIKSSDLPTVKPDTYILCVMWKDSDYVTHRYKLWEDVDEVFYFPVSLYAGQLIKKNFRIEIWTTLNTGPTVISGDVILDDFGDSVLGHGDESILGE